MLRHGRGSRGIHVVISNDKWCWSRKGDQIGPPRLGGSPVPCANALVQCFSSTEIGGARVSQYSVLRSMRQFQMNPLYLFFLINVDTSMHLNVKLVGTSAIWARWRAFLTDAMTSSWPRLTQTPSAQRRGSKHVKSDCGSVRRRSYVACVLRDG